MKLQHISLAQACADMDELAEQYAPQTKVLFAVFVKKPVLRHFEEEEPGGFESATAGITANLLEALAEKVKLGQPATLELDIGEKAYTLWLNPQVIEKEKYERIQGE